jgi:hypothetical protein
MVTKYIPQFSLLQVGTHENMQSDLKITLAEMFSKSKQEHKSDIESLFAQVSQALKERSLEAPILEYLDLDRESNLPSKRGAQELHFMTLPILARIHLELEREILSDIVVNILQPIILNWLDTEPKKTVDFEVDGKSKRFGR